MLVINKHLQIPLGELAWQFVRSGGPGGQNVNKVASKAVLHWEVENNSSLPAEVKQRLRSLHRRRFTRDGFLVLSSQRFRDRERNRQDCLDKLQSLVIEAAAFPRLRKPTRPTRASREARLHTKKHRTATKKARKVKPDQE